VGATRAGASEFRTCRSSWRQGSSGRTIGSLVSAPMWSRVAACPVGELRERAAELAFQASDVGAVPDALEPLQHQRRILAVLPDLFIGVCANAIGDPAPPSGSPPPLASFVRHRRDRSRGGSRRRRPVERAGAEPADVVHRKSSGASCLARAPRPAWDPGDCKAPAGSP